MRLKRPSKNINFSFLNNKYAFPTVSSLPVKSSMKNESTILVTKSLLKLLVCFLTVPFNKKGDDVTPKITRAKRLRTVFGLVAKTLSNHRNLRNSLSGSTIPSCKNAFSISAERATA